MSRGEQINPRMLSWARETAGLSIEEAAEKLGLKNTTKARATDKLGAFEVGERAPSQTLLLKASAAYRRPMIAFYLPERPRRGQRGDDFRTVIGAVSVRDNGILDALLRGLRARQRMLREVLQDEDEARPLPFVASARVEDGATTVAGAIRTALGITEEQQRAAKGPAGLFTLFRDAVERIGIFVLLARDLGSYHSDISEEVFRGVALADDVAPFVVINENDAMPARTFTLVHELAHVWTGASGVSGPLRGLPDNVIERFCNDVAGEFLLPSEAVSDMSHLRGADVQVVLSATERLAEVWNVSQGAVTYRLAQKNWIGVDPCVRNIRGTLASRKTASQSLPQLRRNGTLVLRRAPQPPWRGTARRDAPSAAERDHNPHEGRTDPRREPVIGGAVVVRAGRARRDASSMTFHLLDANVSI